MGRVLMLQNDGITQTLTFFGQDADGDGTAWRPTTSPTMRISGATTTATALATIWVFPTAMIAPTPPATPPSDGKGALTARRRRALDFTDVFSPTTPSGTTKTATATVTTKRGIQRTTARRPPEPPIRPAWLPRRRWRRVQRRKRPLSGDATQWADTDQDGYGDNTLGMGGDGCPMMFGNSTLGLLGCPDQDGDGHADIEDDLLMDPTQ